MGDLAGELCDLCGGLLRAEIVDMEFTQDGELVMCKGVPADLCTQCGEKYFSTEVMESVMGRADLCRIKSC